MKNQLRASKSLSEQLNATRIYKAVQCADERFVMVTFKSGQVAVIFLLDGDLPMAVLKKAIKDNTVRRLHSLFVVWEGLLPPEGASTELSPAFNVLRTLYREKIYGYRLVD